MKSFILLLLISLQSLAIIGIDDRVPVEDTTVFPYSAVGTVLGFAPGTGFLIAPSIAVTAAHVAKGLAFDFGPGNQRQQSPFASVKIIKTVYPKPYEEANCIDDINFTNQTICDAYDFAFLLLDQSIGETTGYFKLSTFYPADDFKLELHSIGYGAPSSTVQKEQPLGCTGYIAYSQDGYRRTIPLSTPDNGPAFPVIYSSCDGQGGDSGSPLIARIQDQWVVTGIQVRVANGNFPDWPTASEGLTIDWYMQTLTSGTAAIPAQMITTEFEKLNLD